MTDAVANDSVVYDVMTQSRVMEAATPSMPNVLAQCIIDADRGNPPESLHMTMGEYLSKMGKTQLRIAETQKYAHVTFFFNGGEERVFPGEDRILIPSPPAEEVPTFEPAVREMSAYEVTDAVIMHRRGEVRRHHPSTSPTATWWAMHGRDQGGDQAPSRPADEGRGRVVDADRQGTAASASSPPTTATPTRCSTPCTAARSPRTPPTRCR